MWFDISIALMRLYRPFYPRAEVQRTRISGNFRSSFPPCFKSFFRVRSSAASFPMTDSPMSRSPGLLLGSK
jgi:hypothetical protein